MTCTEYPPVLSRFLDKELPQQETAEIEDHLSKCEDCRALKVSWELQSAFLRDHFRGHLLGDAFVEKVMKAVPIQPRETGLPGRTGAGRRRPLLWLQAAAAIVLAAVAIHFYFSDRNSVGYARVMDPGELEVLQSSRWVHATVGEFLHPGEWLRNPVQGAPEIMWKDTCRFTLAAGTLAHFPDEQSKAPDHVVLISGAIASDVPRSGRDFQVSTPAGSVTSSLGRFLVRVTDHTLAQLMVSPEGSETLTGTIVPIGEVSVREGSAVIQAAQATQVVAAGTSAIFSASDFSSAMMPPNAVEASLRVIPRTTDRGSIHASFHSTSESVWISVEASNVSIRKLLEWATSSEVRGGEDTNVAGHLRFPAHQSPESVASAVGSAIGLPISYKQERNGRMIAVGHLAPMPRSDTIQGEFTFERSPNGRISFSFLSVPAGQVFRVLRCTAPRLPELSAETAAMPVSIQASDLSPEEIPTWIGQALDLEIKVADSMSGVIEIGRSDAVLPGPGAAVPGAQRAPVPRVSPIGGRSSVEIGPGADGSPDSGKRRDTTAESSTIQRTSNQTPVGRPLWSIIDPRSEPMGFYASRAAAEGNQSVAKGKTSQKKRQFLGIADLFGNPSPSTHLIWPTLELEGALGAEAPYLVTNPTHSTARSLWYGYDQAGQLIAQYEILVGGSSTLTLLPNRDLPTFLGAGGHWETYSDLALLGSRDGELSNGLGWPANSEGLMRHWAFPSALLNLGARLWLVNTDTEPASVMLVMMKNGTAVATESLRLPPHAAVIWPEAGSGAATGLTILVSNLEGKAAAGLR